MKKIYLWLFLKISVPVTYYSNKIQPCLVQALICLIFLQQSLWRHFLYNSWQSFAWNKYQNLLRVQFASTLCPSTEMHGRWLRAGSARCPQTSALWTPGCGDTSGPQVWGRPSLHPTPLPGTSQLKSTTNFYAGSSFLSLWLHFYSK